MQSGVTRLLKMSICARVKRLWPTGKVSITAHTLAGYDDKWRINCTAIVTMKPPGYMPGPSTTNPDLAITAPSVFRRGLLVAALVGGCGGGGGGGANADALTSGDAGPGEFQPHRIGYINLVEGGGIDSVFAQLRDRGELPLPQLIARDGECAVYVHPQPSLCSPACTNGFCVATDTCELWPEFAPAGTISVTGTNEPVGFVPGQYWYDVNPSPTGADLFDEGAAITVSAPGDVTPGFTLGATGVAPLEASFPVTLELQDGVDKEITWTAEASGRIQLALQVGWHGAPYEALLLCETDDDGSLTVPGALITQFPRASSSLEQHASSLTRFTRDVVTTPAGPIELFVGSRVTITQLGHP
jgi:hypothetical protein